MNHEDTGDIHHDYALPTTLEEYETLVDLLVEQYDFKDRRHVAAVISVAIRQLPNHEDSTTLAYLGGWVRKSLANHVAYHMANVAKHDSQLEALASLLEKEPLNQQARDELMKAAVDGSDKAKELCKEFNVLWCTPNEAAPPLSIVPSSDIVHHLHDDD